LPDLVLNVVVIVDQLVSELNVLLLDLNLLVQSDGPLDLLQDVLGVIHLFEL
jgi:hypothetical protein